MKGSITSSSSSSTTNKMKPTNLAKPLPDFPPGLIGPAKTAKTSDPNKVLEFHEVELKTARKEWNSNQDQVGERYQERRDGIKFEEFVKQCQLNKGYQMNVTINGKRWNDEQDQPTGPLDGRHHIIGTSYHQLAAYTGNGTRYWNHLLEAADIKKDDCPCCGGSEPSSLGAHVGGGLLVWAGPKCNHHNKREPLKRTVKALSLFDFEHHTVIGSVHGLIDEHADRPNTTNLTGRRIEFAKVESAEWKNGRLTVHGWGMSPYFGEETQLIRMSILDLDDPEKFMATVVQFRFGSMYGYTEKKTIEHVGEFAIVDFPAPTKEASKEAAVEQSSDKQSSSSVEKSSV